MVIIIIIAILQTRKPAFEGITNLSKVTQQIHDRTGSAGLRSSLTLLTTVSPLPRALDLIAPKGYTRSATVLPM